MKPGITPPRTDQDDVELGIAFGRLMADPAFTLLLDLTELRIFERWEKSPTTAERENLWGTLQGTRDVLKTAEVAVARMARILKARENERRQDEHPEV